MRCDKCGNKAVFFQSYSGRHLCRRHLLLDIEARAKRSIRSHRWIRPRDHIAVLVSGNRRSAALLCFLKKMLADRRDIRLSAVLCGDYRAGGERSSAAREIADSLRVPCIPIPSPGSSGDTGPGAVTKIATAASLDDIAGSVIGEFLFGNTGRLVSSQEGRWHGIPVICPFISVPSDELDLYWEDAGIKGDTLGGDPECDSLMQEIRLQLENYSRRHPATKYALLHLAEQLGSGNLPEITEGCGLCTPITDEDPFHKRPNS